MVGVFVALGNLIRDFGMPIAALEAKELSHQQASNLFWMNAALAGGSAGLLALASPLLVWMYSEPRLASLVPSLAAVVLLGGLGAQIQVGLARDMRYKALVISDLAGQLLALLAAVLFAIQGAGHWALVVQSVVAAAVTLAMRWAASKWIPARFRRGHGSGHIFRSGMQYGLAQFLTFLQSNLDTVIIGVRLGATPLGFYNRGYQILTAPAGRLLAPLTQVVVPTLNRARAQGHSYEPLLLRIQFMVGVGMVWLFSVTAGTADRLIPFVLGPGWDSTVTVFKILAVGGCFWVFSTVSYWAFILNQQSRELLRYNLISKPLAILCLVGGSFFGIEGVAWGYVVAMALSWPLNLAWLARTAELPARSFAANGSIVISAGIVGGATGWLVTAAVQSPQAIIAVVCGGLAGTAAMGGFLLAIPSARRQLAGAAALVKVMLGKSDVGGDL
jgi:PST family polysaccharide transporter